MFDKFRIVIDWSAVGVALSAMAGWLPAIASLFSIIWFGFLIYDRIRYGPKR
jgi:hypothetical protein